MQPERWRTCRTWVRVRKFEQDPTFNLIGRPRGPQMKCGWGCGAKLTGRNMRALHNMDEAAGSLRARGPARKELVSQAWMPAGAANAVRLALRHHTGRRARFGRLVTLRR